MGDPRKLKNKFKRPRMLFDKYRIEEDSKLRREYGLKNMSELWVSEEELKKVRREARRLLSLSEEERGEQEEEILAKLVTLGIIKEEGIKLEDVLSLSVRDFLERRLQTIVFRKGLAKTILQSRQLITHGFISLDRKKVTVPSMLIKKDDERKIGYYKPIHLEPKEKSEQKKEEKIGIPSATTETQTEGVAA